MQSVLPAARHFRASALVLALLALGAPLMAQSNAPPAGGAKDGAELATRVQSLESQVKALQDEVEALKAALTAAAVAPAPSANAQAGAPGPPAGVVAAQVPSAQPEAMPPAAPPASAEAQSTGPLPVYGGAASAAKVLNPDISMIGDFIGSIGHNPIQPIPSLEMHESELGLQAIIDPYARGDFFLTFGEEGVGLEEGYVTFTALPAGFVARVGKMRADLGKVNTLHNHVLPWIDRPMVTDRLAGGEDGIDDAGLSVTRIFAGPKNTFLEGTAQVFRGDSDDLFRASHKSDVAYVGHFRGYRDFGESSNLDLGFSYARGHNDFGSQFLTNLYAIDATFRWKPLRRAIYHSFLGRAEIIWNRREQPVFLNRAYGYYASGEYRINRRWSVGGRWDWTERQEDALLHDRGASAILTYWPSEFSQVRWQYRFARYAEHVDTNELRFQFMFSLGAHGAHPF